MGLMLSTVERECACLLRGLVMTCLTTTKFLLLTDLEIDVDDGRLDELSEQAHI